MSRWWRWGLRLAISIGALALAFQINATLSGQPSLQRPDLSWLVVAFVSHLSIVGLLSLRLGLTLELLSDRVRISPMQLLSANWASLAVGQIALGTLSGDAVRILAVSQGGAPLGQSVAMIVADRLIGLLALVLLGAIALCVAFPLSAAAPMTVLVGTCVLGFFLLGLLNNRPLRSPMGARLSRFAAMLWSLIRRPGGWACLALALIAHALSIVVFYATARAFGIVPPLIETVVAVPAGLLSSVLPVSIGGWGLRELTVAGTYQAMDVSFPSAVLASVLFGVINIAFNLPGLLALWHGFGAVWRKADENQD